MEFDTRVPWRVLCLRFDDRGPFEGANMGSIRGFPESSRTHR